MLTINALIKLTNTPAIIERNTKREIVPLFSGHKTPIPPIHIPMLERFANPHKEIAQIMPVLGSRALNLAPRSWNATNSFKISLFPSKDPSNKTFCPSNPRRYPNGAKMYEKICDKLIPNLPRIRLNTATIPTNPTMDAPIEMTICIPVFAPSAKASIALELSPLLSIFTSVMDFAFSV